eukprot:755135-Hanusia_phi.AAC.9
MADVVLGVHVEDVVSASTDRSLAHSLLIRTTSVELSLSSGGPLLLTVVGSALRAPGSRSE